MAKAEDNNYSLVHGTSNANKFNDTLIDSNYIILIIFCTFIVVIVLIYAFCKYKSLDEGTYTIDEAKNCGPFAELDAPLNGFSKSGKKIKTKKKIMLNANNKEWFV